MSSNKKLVVSLLIGYGLFATQSLAEDFTSELSDESTISFIKYLKEKENEVTLLDLSIWEGELSKQDRDLIKMLVQTKLYNQTNAETFVRSLKEEEVQDLSALINEDSLRRARQVVAATVD